MNQINSKSWRIPYLMGNSMLVFIGGAFVPLSGLHKSPRSLCDAEEVNASRSVHLVDTISLLLKSAWSLGRSCFVPKLTPVLSTALRGVPQVHSFLNTSRSFPFSYHPRRLLGACLPPYPTPEHLLSSLPFKLLKRTKQGGLG